MAKTVGLIALEVTSVINSLTQLLAICVFFDLLQFIDSCPYVFGNISAKEPVIQDSIKTKLVLPIILIILGILEMLLLLYLTIVLCHAYEGLTSEVSI